MFSGCSDEETPIVYTPPNNEINASDTGSQPNTIRRNEATIEGLTYNIDSITYKALILYNKVNVNSICAGIIVGIIERDKKIAFQSEIQTLYCFQVSKEDIDSLKQYGFNESDISHTDATKPIYITGAAQYSAKGLWETVRLGNVDYEKKYPKLYREACAIFLRNKAPRITSVTVTDQASKYVDYSAEFQYNDDQNVYIYFTVKNVNQKIEIMLNKSDS
ncbi:hypothetical protein CJD36_002685 [Flavipsychrobacter stenotrophus]|uniref:Uncharacterized protein n=1 Tax=Flavipsychrobacter stenotrophus TaxID=2077091 RepID=A0A2S7T0E4_9BACT|nr:hypothetical protein CJD36_002685 [Flavipsychrobacter stenotrophus]